MNEGQVAGCFVRLCFWHFFLFSFYLGYACISICFLFFFSICYDVFFIIHLMVLILFGHVFLSSLGRFKRKWH